MAQVNVTYPVGGWIDEVRKLPPVAVQSMPPISLAHAPTKSDAFAKGFRLEVPALAGDYAVTYEAPEDMELVSVSTACSGYADKDYWELEQEVDGTTELLFETIYTKEVPEAHAVGAGLSVLPVKAGTVLTMRFSNGSGTHKIVWFTLRFLRDPRPAAPGPTTP